MLGREGELLTAARDFYAIFATDQEWKLITGGRTLGTIPISNPVGDGGIVSFAGQRWKITTVDDPAKVLEVVRHASGKIPKVDGLANEPVHDRLAVMMRNVLMAHDVPSYLEAQAAEYLLSARETFKELGLEEAHLLATGRDTHVLTWTRNGHDLVLAFAITAAGLDCEVLDIGVTVLDTAPDAAKLILQQIAESSPHRGYRRFCGRLADGEVRQARPRANAASTVG